jgi:hypothetical protein
MMQADSDDYVRAWNDAVEAAVERLRNHQIDWMSDKTFGQMKGELLDAVKSLHRPTPASVSAQLDRDAENARVHTRLLRRLSQAVTLRNRFFIDGWRRALRTRGFDDVSC